MKDKQYITSKFLHTAVDLEEQRREKLDELRYDLIERWGVDPNRMVVEEYNEKIQVSSVISFFNHVCKALEDRRADNCEKNDNYRSVVEQLQGHVETIVDKHYPKKRTPVVTTKPANVPTVTVQAKTPVGSVREITEQQKMQQQQEQSDYDSTESEFEEAPKESPKKPPPVSLLFIMLIVFADHYKVNSYEKRYDQDSRCDTVENTHDASTKETRNHGEKFRQ
jgi:hypothetical protein